MPKVEPWQKYGMGRLPSVRDPRNEAFMLAALFDSGLLTAQPPKKSVMLRLYARLNQGDEPKCVGFSGEHWQRTAPSLRGRKGVSLDAHGYYQGAQQFDEWPGEGYEGTSVHGLMEFMLAHPDLDVASYRHITNTGALLQWFNQQDTPITPPIIGVNWYMSMFNPDANGRIHISGQVAGGHALIVIGYKLDSAGVPRWYLHNSWGESWGVKGRCWITDAELQRLFNEDGECVIATKIPRSEV